MTEYDAVVVGAGPNGLAAAAHLTASGHHVLVVEGTDRIGGGTRTEELTLPGFLHDVCSGIHPLGIASPFFKTIDLSAHGLDWIHPTVPMTHPLGNGRVGVLYRSLDETIDRLGQDGPTYRRLLGSLSAHADQVIRDVLGPVSFPPNHPLIAGRFGAVGSLPASALAKRFATPEARALVAGLAAHAIVPPTRLFTGAVAMLFAISAHGHGWPMARRGSRSITDALASIVLSGGGELQTDRMVHSLGELPKADATLLDVMPPSAAGMIGHEISSRASRRIGKWRSGPGVFKLDWALEQPIPWQDEASPGAGTVHVGGTYAEVGAAEAEVAAGVHPEQPFVIVAQQSQFDSTRAPEGKHTASGYCHVPAWSTVDMTDAIERQIERFAPGFRDVILARHKMGPAQFDAYNPNYVGGDIAGGAFSVRKLFQLGRRKPYRLGDGIYLCSSATPPGAGVHGMCGYHAAQTAMA